MTGPEKMRIKPLDSNSNYMLWNIRVQTACNENGLTSVRRFEESPKESRVEEFEKMKRQASKIMISSLTDKPQRVVRSIVGSRFQMMQKLDQRYDFRTTASRISKMSELMSLRYTSISDDLTAHINNIAALVEQLKSMDIVIQDVMSVGILLASIEVPELFPVTAAIKTLAEEDVSWTSRRRDFKVIGRISRPSLWEESRY